MQRLPNGEIFRKAASEKRTVLTFDLDFGEIAALTRGERTGVIVLRLQNARFQHVIDRLSAVLAESAAALEKPTVISVQEGRHRIRYFPAGSQSDKE